MSTPDNHGLTPTRPRVSVLEAEILDQIRDLRERVAALESLEAAGPQPANVHCFRCSTVFFDRDGTRYCHPCSAARAGAE